MDPKSSSRALVTLSLAYGITIGILAALDSSATTPVAIIGALLLGVLWAVRGMLLKRSASAE